MPRCKALEILRPQELTKDAYSKKYAATTKDEPARR
jgi:hypothetical protein